MKILSATIETDDGHEQLSREQIEADTPEIQRIHDEKCETDLTWPYFGGIVTVGDRKYQVAP